MPSVDLKGKNILVTGAGRRIGQSIAIRLAHEGANIIVHYHQSEQGAQETARACQQLGATVWLYKADLSNVSAIRQMFLWVEQELGQLFGLVNNAAIYSQIDPMKITELDWDQMLNVNLRAVFFCSQQAARIMFKSGGGRIVNISSLGALRPWPESAHYCASKAGVVMLTKALARAWAPTISVNTVAPGLIPFEQKGPEIDELVARTPARRAGLGEEVAEAVVFFLKTTEFITGQLLGVTGGLELT